MGVAKAMALKPVDEGHCDLKLMHSYNDPIDHWPMTTNLISLVVND